VEDIVFAIAPASSHPLWLPDGSQAGVFLTLSFTTFFILAEVTIVPGCIRWLSPTCSPPPFPSFGRIQRLVSPPRTCPWTLGTGHLFWKSVESHPQLVSFPSLVLSLIPDLSAVSLSLTSVLSRWRLDQAWICEFFSAPCTSLMDGTAEALRF